jgi:proline iminopeptidase
MTHPDRVTEILIRGIFLLRNSELKWYYNGGAAQLFPDTYEIFENAIPKEERNDFVKAYNRRLQGELGPEEMKKAAIGK